MQHTSNSDPAPARDVCNSEAVTDDKARRALGEMVVKSAVQATALVDVAVDAVLDLLGSIACSTS